ncbi:hypothetical protein VNO78_30645 [Psophocarpus tetragonolobus]|uniref:Uncharacterized protein n=1 Tax=Psophocarpus tetragonolobus TaxID=3891 RepID=A0AAN9X5S0_PSOTE
MDLAKENDKLWKLLVAGQDDINQHIELFEHLVEIEKRMKIHQRSMNLAKENDKVAGQDDINQHIKLFEQLVRFESQCLDGITYVFNRYSSRMLLMMINKKCKNNAEEDLEDACPSNK